MTGKKELYPKDCIKKQNNSPNLIKSPLLMCIFVLLCSVSNLVYCMRTENIESVMCNGNWIMKDRKIVNVNEVT